MNFLKKAGQLILRGAGIVFGLGPALQQMGVGLPGAVQGGLNRAADLMNQIAGIVVTAEVMLGAVEGATGFDKLHAASPMVEQLIRQSELLAGREIADENKFAQAIRTITGGVADLLNSLKDKGLEVKS